MQIPSTNINSSKKVINNTINNTINSTTPVQNKGFNINFVTIKGLNINTPIYQVLVYNFYEAGFRISYNNNSISIPFWIFIILLLILFNVTFKLRKFKIWWLIIIILIFYVLLHLLGYINTVL